MEKVRLGDLTIDFKEKAIFKGYENQKNKFIDRFEKGTQGWKVLEYFFSHPNKEISAIDLIDNVMKSTSHKAEGVITATISTLVACGLAYEEIFESRKVLGVNYYKFIGKFINLDIEKDKQAYFNALYYQFKFEQRNDSDQKARQLNDFYIKPRFYDVEDKDLALPLEINDKPFKAYISGASGLGKTTLLQALTKVFAKDYVILDSNESKKIEELKIYLFGDKFKDLVPFFISAVDVKTDYTDKEELLDFAFYSGERLKEISAAAGAQGKQLVIIDALDEVESESDLRLLKRLLERFAYDNPNASIIITSRFFNKEIIKKFNFLQIRLGYFSKEDVYEYVDKTIFNDTTKKETFLKRVDNDDEFYELVKNPYCLASLLPEGDLWNDFSKHLQELVESIVSYRCGDNLVLKNKLNNALNYVAWKMIYYNKTNFTHDEILRALQERNGICTSFEDAEKTVPKLLQLSGVLCQDDNGEYYLFQSKLMMYCYAAKHIWKNIINPDIDSKNKSETYVKADCPFKDDSWCTYNKIKSVVNIETEDGIKMLVFTISYLTEIAGASERVSPWLNYLIFSFIFDPFNETIAKGLRCLIDEIYGKSIAVNSVKGKYTKKEILKKLLEVVDESPD